MICILCYCSGYFQELIELINWLWSTIACCLWQSMASLQVLRGTEVSNQWIVGVPHSLTQGEVSLGIHLPHMSFCVMRVTPHVHTLSQYVPL
jgi:hypothetical protein